MIRRILPPRRYGMTFDVRHGGRTFPVTVGCYEDRTIGEVFIGFHKKGGSEADLAARDTAVLISLALQHGVTLETMFDATIKTSTGDPEGVAGVVLGALMKYQQELQS